MQTIAIIGTGVIGTSIGLALKQQPEPPHLLAHDKELSIAQAAVQRRAFDKAEWNLINACEPADIIILAMPLAGLKPTLKAIAPYLKEGVIITDTTRQAVQPLQVAQEILPDHAHFISGNPLVHSTGVGPASAHSGLFNHRPYCLTPAKTVAPEAVEWLVSFINVLGGEPFFLEATEHDGLMVTVETLPQFLSLALMQTVISQPSWRETRKFAGHLFAEQTTAVLGNPDALSEELKANRELLSPWLTRYISQLQQLHQQLMADDSTPLTQQLDQAVTEREKWQHDYAIGHFPDPNLIMEKIERPSIIKKWFGFG